MKTKIQKMVSAKLSQWDSEAVIAATRAARMGRRAIVVTYPSGMEMARFAEPFSDFGMHYEVAPAVWNAITGNK